MQYIESPEIYSPREDERSLYLAGGITGTPDWQQEVTELLQDEDIVILNPRREHFPIEDSEAAADQIRWEFEHLRKADEILFWFPAESVCPIALYELGAWSMNGKPLYLGVHPDYPRRRDVEIQTALVRPDLQILYSLKALAEEVKKDKYSLIEG